MGGGPTETNWDDPPSTVFWCDMMLSNKFDFYLLSLKLIVCRCLQLKMFKTWHGGKFPFWGKKCTFREATQALGSGNLHLCQMISTLKKGFFGKWNQPLAASCCLILVFDWFWLCARVAPFRDSTFREETGYDKLTSWLHCITLQYKGS